MAGALLVVDTTLGNLASDEALALRIQAMEKSGAVERVSVSHSDAQRRRLRMKAASGADIGIAIEAGAALSDGDVLCAGGDDSQVVLVAIAPAEAMAIRVSPALADEDSFAYGVRLGHVLGNQHWPIKVDGAVVLSPVNIDRVVMETVLRTHGFEGLEWEFISVEPGEVPTGMPRIDHHHG